MKRAIMELENLEPVIFDAGEVFGQVPSGLSINGYKCPSSRTPALDPEYIFPDSSQDIIVWLLNPCAPLYVFGPPGCGKTSCVKQLAARLNYPVFEAVGHGRLEVADLTGHHTIRNGDMEFEYGPLSLAMKYGGLFLLNEIDLISPDVAAGLNGVLDGSPLCIAENGGELIMPHPGFRFAATANTNGGGDESGLYQGSLRQNLAFADRFMFCEFSYPEAMMEEALLATKFPALPCQIRKTMVAYANEIRKLFVGENGSDNPCDCLEITFSTRSLLRWADLTLKFQSLARQGISPVIHALDRALAFRAGRETRTLLHELAQRMFPGIERQKAEPAVAPGLAGDAAIQFIERHLAKEVPFNKISVTLRKGADREWIGEIHSTGLNLRFGKAGGANRNRFYKSSDCAGNDPFLELKRRAGKKIREGYILMPELCQIQGIRK